MQATRSVEPRRRLIVLALFGVAALVVSAVAGVPVAGATTTAAGSSPAAAVVGNAATSARGLFPVPRFGYGTPNDRASQAAAALLTVDSGVALSIVPEVIAAIETSPKTVIAAVNKLRPTIRLTTLSIPGGFGGFFDPGLNAVFLDAKAPFLAETTEHELAHVWDSVNNVSGANGPSWSGAVWQFLADRDFRRLSPTSLGLGVGLTDGVFVDGFGTGDVLAELVAYLSHDNQSGNGAVMAEAWPDLAVFLVVSLHLSY